MAAAEAAGAYALGVATGANDEAALKAAGADEVLATLEDFPRWLSGHLSLALGLAPYGETQVSRLGRPA